MLTLTDVELSQDIGCLDRAWAADATFALVPARSSVPREWVMDALRRLPEPWRQGHFALLTSGSTGQPKLIVGLRQRAEALARLLDQVQSGAAAAATVVALPLTYCYAFVNQWLWSRVLGRRLILTQGFGEPESLRVVLAQARDTMLCLVGAQVPLLRRGMPDAVFPGVVRLHFAGGAFPQEHLDFLSDRFPNALIFNNYGCAEAMPRLTLRGAAASEQGANIGWPLPGIALTAGADGRLLFRSPFAAVGVVDAAGIHAFSPDEWVESGDLAVPTADGSWVLSGRSNEVFKRYGEKVSLAQLIGSVRLVWVGEAAFYRETDRQGEQGAVLVLAPSPSADELRRVLSALRAEYPRPHWPLRIEGADVLPRLPSGKIDNLRLAALERRAIVWKQRI
ncbi:class I adenylate-forming enzyme family protein [uncultured Thiodictyon sp.]|uniref:AMP-binding protein n=1 Tax=uncultured Thiodictyon sp. TaxID=1846217 RepID=UPI0025EB729F|nr:class I adenylate-forming enzyme family protein [uncultured Thiodictyon sp.]